MILTKILLAYSCGLMDRVRGDGSTDAFISKTVEQVIYGLAVGALLGFSNIGYTAVFAVLWAVGSSFGWGTPLSALLHEKTMGPKYEWWQFGILKRKASLACAFRGMMWGVCILPLVYIRPELVGFPVAMGVIFPFAILLARRYKIITDIDWARQEYFRGWLVGIFALLLGMGA